jgi:hypothetical protein
MVGNAKVTKDTKESQLAELDRPSGKLFIIVKADNVGATHVFGDFGSVPQDVMAKVSKRGTRDKSGVKTKLKIDFLFDDFRSTVQQLRMIFRDVDFVGAETAEFIIHSSALKSDQGEDVKQLRDYIQSGDDRRMKIYQAPEDDEEDGEPTGGNLPRAKKPQTQMGGKSTEQPGMTTYRFKDPIFARRLRGMNLGFNIKGDTITVDQRQKDDLNSMLGDRFSDVFTNKELFKEKMELPPPGMNPEQARDFANTQMAGQQAINQHAAQQANTPPRGVNYAPDYLEKAASGAPGRWLVSADDAKIALDWLAKNPNYKPPASQPSAPATGSGYSREYLEKAADPNRFGRYMISIEKAQELLGQMKEDTYMESLSAALEQKLNINDTPEEWRDDFEHADPVKYPQFRNKTVEKKHRMADVARYRQIQKK